MPKYTFALKTNKTTHVFVRTHSDDDEAIAYASAELRDPTNKVHYALLRRGDAEASDPVIWDSRVDKHAEPVSPEIVTCYEVQGMYKDRGKTTRSWQCWIPCESIEDARAAYTNGLKLKNRVSDGGFTDLRIVQIEKHITVLGV